VLLAKGFECELSLAELVLVFQEKPYNRCLALLWHHQRDFTKLFLDADVRTVPLCVEAYTLKRVPLLHPHVDAKFSDDDVLGCDGLFVERACVFKIVCVDYLLFCNRVDLISPFSREAFLANERVKLSRVESGNEFPCPLQLRLPAHSDFVNDSVVKQLVLFRVSDCLQVVVE